MARRAISSGSKFEELAGYSRAVVDGEWVFVAGTTGYDYAQGTIADDVAEQARQTFRNIAWALEQAGASLDDVVRATFIITDRAYLDAVAPVFKEFLGRAQYASTALICGLVSPEMKIEIEITAKKR